MKSPVEVIDSGYFSPCEVTLTVSEGDQRTYRCEQPLRLLSGRRLTAVAQSENKSYVIKIFPQRSRSLSEYESELEGYQLLHNVGASIPGRVYYGEADGSVNIILYQYVDRARTLLDIFNAPERTRTIDKYLNLLLQTIVAMHRQHLVHEDPHLGNFLYRSDQLYILDAGAVRKTENELILMDNLALFVAQFPTSWRVGKLWSRQYLEALHGDSHDEYAEYLDKTIIRQRQLREDRILKKIYRECTAYHVVSELDYRMVIDREFEGSELEQMLTDPFTLLDRPEIEMLKEGRSSTVARIDCCGKDMVIKRYNIKSPLHQLKRALTESRASRSWRNAHLLRLRGLPTARPLAMVEYLRGKSRGMSVFVMSHIDGPSSAVFFRDRKPSEEEQEKVANKLLKLLSELKRQSIRHGDLKSTNFILHDKQISLIDLDGLKRGRRGAGFDSQFANDMARFRKNWEGDEKTTELFGRLYEKFELL